jgi:DNA topoisomerase 6 subunit A-like protein/histidine kinase/DNA gyrase B/HSP90-like ATPase
VDRNDGAVSGKGGVRMTAPVANRQVFSTSRAAEFLELRALQSQTGQPVDRFGGVILKELLDNALDAAESAGVVPDIEVAFLVVDDLMFITVADNGPGLPAEVIERILDFNVTVSDKAAYRSPTRGMQGNAFKTIIGIPYALGIDEPVVIDACGTRHSIAASIDPASNVVIRHDRETGIRTVGTSVTVPLPIDMPIDRDWLQSFALVNPHVAFTDLGYESGPAICVSYKPTAGDGWSKPLPTDKTSPWWYDVPAMKRRVFAQVGAIRNGADDEALGMFVRTFEGLSSTAKAKTVCAAVPHIRRLSDFEDDPDAVATMLATMKTEARQPKPAALGRVLEDHYRGCFEDWFGIKDDQFWYRRKETVLDGVPWVVEIAIAATRTEGRAVWAVNYSPTFDDPISRAQLVTPDVTARGAASFLQAADAYPGAANAYARAAVVHILTPAPDFLDKGKSGLTVPAAVAEMCAAALESATKVLRTDAKRRQRDARAQANREGQRQRPTEQITLLDAVFSVMTAAADAARGGQPGDPGTLPFSVRTMYYKLRPLLQQMTARELKYSYFTQNLVPRFQREHGTIADLYYEPRGELHEPHTGKSVPLGTREVQMYAPPEWTYDKVLYVEKTGLWPVLKSAKLAERYDMAIIAGQGYAAEACRDLLAGMAGNVTIFVLHDADSAGYNIGRTLGNETARMPDHNIGVIDLGLTVAEAIRLDLQTETFSRTKELASGLDLSEIEREWFAGVPASYNRRGEPNQWTCTRVELNAFSSPDLIAYVEEGLALHGATEKVVPPPLVVSAEARKSHGEQVEALVQDLLDELIDIPTLTATIAAETAIRMDFAIDPDAVRDALDDDRTRPWTTAVRDEVARRIEATGLDVRARLIELLAAGRPA